MFELIVHTNPGMRNFPGRPLRWTSRSASVQNRIPRVLVVDDNHNAADALAAFLSFGRQKVLAVYGGAAAIAAASVWKPDVVLLDISMPHIDGFTVARALRGRASTVSPIIVALTAHDEQYVRQRASVGDFDAYCQKGHVLDPLSWLLNELITCTGHG
jgi:two-component system, OmpR family, response regulator